MRGVATQFFHAYLTCTTMAFDADPTKRIMKATQAIMASVKEKQVALAARQSDKAALLANHKVLVEQVAFLHSHYLECSVSF